MHYNGQNGHSPTNNSFKEQENSEDEIDLFKLLNVLYLHKLVVITFVVIFSVLAAVYSLSLTPIYNAEGTIFISETKNSYSYAGADLASLLTSSYGIGAGSTIANEMQILRSRKLTTDLGEHLIEREFTSTGKKFPVLWRAYPEDSTTVAVDTVAQRLRKNLIFERVDREADMVRISF